MRKKDITYTSDTKAVIDLMATSIIPLLYVSGSGYHKQIFLTFLNQYPDRRKKIAYLITSTELHNYLDQRSQKLENTPLRIEQKKMILILEKKIERDQNALTLYNSLPHPQNDQIEQKIKSKIINLQKQLAEIEKTIPPINEIQTLNDQVDLFCGNLSDGHRKLALYFQDREDFVDFLLEHQEIFTLFSLNWICYAMNMGHPIINHPLPLYLSPFNTKHPDFDLNLFKRLTLLRQQSLLQLASRIEMIQDTFFPPQEKDSPRQIGSNQEFFQFDIKKNDEDPLAESSVPDIF